MQVASANLSFALRAAATVAVVAMFLALGSPAQAACGDYLLHGSGGRLSGGVPAPCHGPQCSANHSLPAAPLAPPQVLGQHDWLLTVGLAAALGGSSWRPLAAPAGVAAEPPFLSGIFRPPCWA